MREQKRRDVCKRIRLNCHLLYTLHSKCLILSIKQREIYMESQKHRPLGVTLIAILTAIGGIIFLASGLVLLIVGIGIILLALGIIVAIVSVAAGNVSAIISIIIQGIVIYYLYRPNVKAFFGK